MLTKEPAVLFNSLGEIAKAIIPVLILGGIAHWDAKMVAAVMFLISVAVSSLSTAFTRSASVAKPLADKQVEIAKASPIDRPTEQIIEQAAKEVK